MPVERKHTHSKANANFDYWLNDAINQDEYEEMIFFYHKDLPKAFGMGSSTQISDGGANIIQHIEYLPYGEPSEASSRTPLKIRQLSEQTFFERRDIWNTPYKFNAKELDEETGMYYYGARYYTPEVSIWLSVDPLADKYPSMSPYMYCAGNPVMFIDPDGMKVKYANSRNSQRTWVGNYLRVLYDRISDRSFRQTHRDYRQSKNTYVYKDCSDAQYSRPKDGIVQDYSSRSFVKFNTKTKTKKITNRPTSIAPPPDDSPLNDPLPIDRIKVNVNTPPGINPLKVKVSIHYDAATEKDDISIVDNNTGNVVQSWNNISGKGVLRTSIDLNALGSNNLSVISSQNPSSVIDKELGVQQSSIQEHEYQ